MLLEAGFIIRCDVEGPISFQPPIPPYFWYGIHLAELAIAAMGPGCQTVHVDSQDAQVDSTIAPWHDGRVANIRAFFSGHTEFKVVLQGQEIEWNTNVSATRRPYYASMIEAILSHLPSGKICVPIEETLDIISFLEACNESRITNNLVCLKTPYLT